MIKIINKTSRSLVSNIAPELITRNGIVLTVQEILKYSDDIPAIGKYEGRGRSTRYVAIDTDGWYRLSKGMYKILTNHYCDMASGECGIIFPDKNLSNLGIIISNDVYESGYSGTISFNLSVDGSIDIQKHAGLAKFFLFEAEDFYFLSSK